MKRICSIFLLTFCVYGSLHAQDRATDPLLFGEDDDISWASEIPIDEGSMLLITLKSIAGKLIAPPNRFWKYVLYDTNFKGLKEVEISIPKNFKGLKTSLEDGHLYIYHYDIQGPYIMVDLELSSFEYTLTESASDRNRSIHSYLAAGKYLYAFESSGDKSFLKQLDPKHGEEISIPLDHKGYYVDENSKISLDVLEDTKDIVVHFNGMKADKRISYIYGLDKNGNMYFSVEFTNSKEKALKEIKFSKVSDNKFIISGTFFIPGESGSHGIFCAMVDNSEITKMNYYNYLDLENFTDFLPEKHEKKVVRMTEKAEKSGKDLYIGIDVNIHSIINKNGKFYLIGEVYHETYETVTSTYNGVKTTTTRFAGFQFTHGMVLAFNEETELVWNYVFEMELKDKRMDWEKNVSVIGIDQRITFAFLNEGYISLHFVSFDGANIEMKKYYNRITTMSSQLQYATHGEITPWCDHSFLTSGYSKIKDSQQRIGKRNQRYYYVNKINF